MPRKARSRSRSRSKGRGKAKPKRALTAYQKHIKKYIKKAPKTIAPRSRMRWAAAMWNGKGKKASHLVRSRSRNPSKGSRSRSRSRSRSKPKRKVAKRKATKARSRSRSRSRSRKTKGKPKRKLSSYNRFVKKNRKQGKSMKACAAAWGKLSAAAKKKH